MAAPEITWHHGVMNTTKRCQDHRAATTSSRLLFAAATFVSIGMAFASEPALPGYAKRIDGDVLDYHCADPDVTQGLLVRSIDASRSIVWETARVPLLIDADFVNFVWLFGLDVDADRHRFELRVNDAPWFTWRSPETSAHRDLVYEGPAGATLRLRATLVDRFDDLMGYATLRVPRTALTPGEPLKLEVAGESAGDQDWYITFMGTVREGVRAQAPPALLRGEHGLERPLEVVVTHLGPPIDATVTTSCGVTAHKTLELGSNRFLLRIPAELQEVELRTVVRLADGRSHELVTTLATPRAWTVDLVQHTHTDVGYTRPQTEILPEHLRFIDTALDLCDQTDALPEPARFRWTCEVSWPVREYLRRRTPAQIERLRRRVAEGRIEVTGMFLNMSEIVDEASFAAFLEPVHEIRAHGIPVTTAMQNDVNGMAWCLADHFADIGITYLVMGQHGHRALAPFDRPTCFFWESPAGRRVMAFREDHYMTGNFHGVHGGDIDAVAPELLRYLSTLEAQGYPWDRIAIQHSGYPTDNAPPSTASSTLVEAWNERFAWPRLRCSVASDFLKDVATHHADELPVRRQAWPDWWVDGFGSAARETAAARAVQGRLAATEGMLAMEVALGGEPAEALRNDLEEARDALLFYGEHTFGAAESIRDPLCENQVMQWYEKAAYAWEAVKRSAGLHDAALERLPVVLERAENPRLIVINTLGHARSGVVEVFADHELLPIDRRFRIVDETGRALPFQRIRSRVEGSTWAIFAHDVPAFGWRTYRVDVDRATAPDPAPTPRPATALSNAHYELALDAETGTLARLVDRATGRQLVDPASSWGFGAPIYETLSDRQQLEAFRLVNFERTGWTNVVVEGVVDGPVWSRLSLRGELPGCDGVRCDIRLFHPEKRIAFDYTVRKRRVFAPDGLYVAFPFGPRTGKILYEAQGAAVSLPNDVMEGGATDWQAMQGYASVQWADDQVVLSSNEAPLAQFGGIRLGEFRRTVQIERPHVFGWVMNDYWTTNFLSGQEGEFRFSYVMTSQAGTARLAATRFGQEHRIPCAGRVVPGGGTAETFATRSLVPASLDGLVLVSARPHGNARALLLQFREVEGRESRLDMDALRATLDARHARASDVLGTLGEELTRFATFRAYETRTFAFEMDT